MSAKKPPDHLPDQLLAAFRAIEDVTDIAVLMNEESFDATTIRVLGSFQKASHKWVRPKRAMPDGGRPTPTAWAWLVEGWWIDVAAIAVGANVSRDVARDRVELLKQARLIYPDGSISQHAKKAVGAAIGARLRAAGGGKKKDDRGKKDDEKGN